MAQLIKAVVDTQKNSYKSIGQVNAYDDLELELEVKMNGQPIEFINPQAELLIKKSDKNKVRQLKDIRYEDGKFRIKVDEQGVTYPGIVTNQLVINDEGRVSTCLFYFMVGTSLDREILQSISKIETLEQLDEYVVTAFANLDEYEKRIIAGDSAIRKLNDDMIAAEKVRDAAEAKRQENYNTAEASREELYSNSELTRNNNYRNAEADRDRSYSEAEANRNNLFNNCKAEMDAATQNSKNEENRRANTFSNLRTEIQALKTQMEQNESGRVAAEETRVNEFNTMKSENENFKQEINEQYEHIATKVGDETQGLVKDVNDLKNNQGNSITNKKLIAKYVHSSNKVIQPTFFDLNTGIFTCANHGLTESAKLMINFNVIDFSSIKVIPKELFLKINSTFWSYFKPIIIDENTFTLDGITYDTSINANVDISKFWFESIGTEFITLSNLPNLNELKHIQIITNDSKINEFGLALDCLNNKIQSPYRYWIPGNKIDLIPLSVEHIFSVRGLNLSCVTDTIIQSGISTTKVIKSYIPIDGAKYSDNWNVSNDTYSFSQLIDGVLDYKKNFKIDVNGRQNIRNGFTIEIYDLGVE